VRSVQKVNPDGSLTLYCAIDEGVVLRLARGTDLVQNLTDAFAGIDADIGPLQLVLGFDCIQRKMAMIQQGLADQVEEILRDHSVTGFTTYGEQFGGLHLNQTLTGIAIGDLAND
jgi:hypothetical protein